MTPILYAIGTHNLVTLSCDPLGGVAHEQEGQHRKGSDIPYIIHPFGVMLLASNITDDKCASESRNLA